MSTSKDEQARQRLVEMARNIAEQPKCPACNGSGNFMLGTAPNACMECDGSTWHRLADAFKVRHRAGMNPCKGSWCAAGLTAAMEDAGLVVPAPGTPARHGAIALLDFVIQRSPEWWIVSSAFPRPIFAVQPGDIIAWKQNPEPEEWRLFRGVLHAFAVSASKSMCGLRRRENGVLAIPDGRTKKCSACEWETRKGHVAVIVAVDDESITTVGWNEGPSPGRVMMRRLWRDHRRRCDRCRGQRTISGPGTGMGGGLRETCPACLGGRYVRPTSTVLYRRPGGLYGIARPVAR